MSWRLVALFLAVSVSVVLLAGAGASSQTSARGAACPVGTVNAVIAGNAVCLKSGRQCLSRFNVGYGRHGFDCVVGLLIRRSGWVITTLGSPWWPVAINERGQVIGNFGWGFTGYRTPPDLRAVTWENGRLIFLAPSGWGDARAINEVGQIIGRNTTNDGSHYFIWQDGVLTELDLFPVGLNDSGQVVGNAAGQANGVVGRVWTNGVLTTLSPAGAAFSQVPDETSAVINGRGQVLMTWGDGRGDAWMVVWENGVLTNIGSTGRGATHPLAINEVGQILLRGTNSKGLSRAYLWDKGVVRDLGSLAGSNTDPRALNNRGQVVGRSLVGQNFHAFLWDNGKMRDLGTLGGRESGANAINDRGQVIGGSQTKDGHTHAFLWQNGKMIDLAPVGTLERAVATAINERGQIVGQITRGSKQEAVMWTLRNPR